MKQKRDLTWGYALKSFAGHLQGTGKAQHTVASYHFDLRTFEEFLKTQFGKSRLSLHAVTAKDLERYQEFLRKRGYKTNTRRRKLLTIRRFYRYLSKRGKLPIDLGRKLPAPYKMERVPKTFDYLELIEKIKALPTATPIEARNRVLLWVLAETGCQAGEAVGLRFSHFSQGRLEILGKRERSIPLSSELSAAAQDLQKRASKGLGSDHAFLGFNKFGPLGGAITVRGVELLVRVYSKRLGLNGLLPRSFRHTAIVHWKRSGISEAEIQRRLGLRTNYSFRIYEPLFRSRTRSRILATSSGETPLTGS